MEPAEFFDRLLDRAPSSMAAAIDLRRPSLWDSWGGPLNGQRGRQAMVRDLVNRCAFVRIVETGTFRGTTTQYLADLSGVPVYSCEARRRYYRFACARLANRDVHVELMDSRAFLTTLAGNPETSQGATLFYLDAHWEEDLPLPEELRIIAPHWPDAVVIVDDFRVPRDDGYMYDDYGPGKVLDESLLPVGSLKGWRLAFPALTAQAETGARRGCCILIGPSIAEQAFASPAISFDRLL